MAKCINIISRTSKFAYITPICKTDSFRHCNHNRGFFLEEIFDFDKEFINIKRNFRQIDKIWSITVFCTCKCCRTGQPSCITSHDLHDRDHTLLIGKALCITDDFFGRRANVFGCTSETWCMISQCKVIINGLWNTKEFLLLASKNRIIRKFLYGIHRIVSANVDKRINIQAVQDFKDFLINCFIFVNLRKFETT